MPYKPYVPRDLGGVLDFLALMMLFSPTFKDKTGYFPERNVDTTFYSLNEGLLGIRKTLGEERYATLRDMSVKMRALFESDPDEKTGDTTAGRMLIQDMEDILESVAKHEASI
jgi:hypothetical protein